MVSVGYGTNLPNQKLDFAQAKSYWYHWLMATEKGEQLIREDKKAFAKIMWDTWSPAGWYSPEEFDATWQAVDNDDWLPVTLHSYRHRWGHAPSDPYYAADEAVLQYTPTLSVPTLVLHGEIDPILPLEHSRRFAAAIAGAELIVYPGIGHLPQREIPERSAADVAAFVARTPDTRIDLSAGPAAPLIMRMRDRLSFMIDHAITMCAPKVKAIGR